MHGSRLKMHSSRLKMQNLGLNLSKQTLRKITAAKLTIIPLAVRIMILRMVLRETEEIFPEVSQT